MKRSARHAEAIEVDLDAAALMLEHTRDQWLPEHHAITAGMFHALVEMRRRLAERCSSSVYAGSFDGRRLALAS
jgi:hypothetical protein